MGVQALGVIATFVFAGGATWVLLTLVDKMVGLRVDADEETEGLDIVLHEERGYVL